MMIRATLCACMIAIQAAPAAASTIAIWPVDPVLTGTQTATVLWLENKGDAPVTLQVRALRWSQADGRDVTEAQDEIVVSPPFARVGPGERQLVRIIRRQPAAVASERSFRLFVDELPPPPIDQATSVRAGAQLSVQMRYSIPLFLKPSADAGAPRLIARLRTTGAARTVALHNAGAVTARLTDLAMSTSKDKTEPQGRLIGYVLPGATMAWPLPVGQSGGAVRVTVNGVAQTLTPEA